MCFAVGAHRTKTANDTTVAGEMDGVCMYICTYIHTVLYVQVGAGMHMQDRVRLTAVRPYHNPLSACKNIGRPMILNGDRCKLQIY